MPTESSERQSGSYLERTLMILSIDKKNNTAFSDAIVADQLSNTFQR